MWEAALALNKWLLYGALSVAVGGTATVLLWTPRGDMRPLVKAYLVPACIAGLLLSAAGFFIQVGAFAESGLPGMFEPVYLSILWQSPAGNVALLQSLGFAATALAALSLPLDRRRVAAALWLLGAILLLLPFGWRGHTAELPLLTRAALSLHVAVAAFWMGALYPLWRLCRGGDPVQCRNGMEQFGRLAAWLVALLVVCGTWLLYALLDGWGQLLRGSYGLLLSLKLLFVGALLLLAAQNKWQLVPRLPALTGRLARSIRTEILVGAVILLITALVTTLTGPQH
ncbi:CopD family protein [Microbulbifer marinus]|uniref:Copper resistance protein D n=1 Tax=Microbulbifer marinus TaxID=658218 RepID=A0A1H4BEB4_9GAMM|nr:CopD family protein [Microbulbifer marinus]SEA46555.1 putative copper resistance protein D [Microbulbifer marinus]